MAGRKFAMESWLGPMLFADPAAAFSVTEIPAHALEAQWKGAENPMEKTFASLTLGVARGFDSDMEPPFDKFPMQLTTPREFVRGMAKSG